jgi:hypothetical protein
MTIRSGASDQARFRQTGDMSDWIDVTTRNARSVQTTVGWIFWDPGAVARYRAAGLPEGLAGSLGYIAARCAPLAPAGHEAVTAALGSISPRGIKAAFDLLDADGFARLRTARDEAVTVGLATHAPELVEPLVDMGPHLWAVVDTLPTVGRVFFAAHLAGPRPTDALLSGWHAVNCLREWRGDTHWALVVAGGLTHPEASILHNAWLGYEDGWLARSRGTTPEDIDAGWRALESKGLAVDRVVTDEGVGLRQQIEDETDRLTSLPWQLLGGARSAEFAERFEPSCELLLRRVNETAGLNYQPASRIRSVR